jgi:hypothetical protein
MTSDHGLSPEALFTRRRRPSSEKLLDIGFRQLTLALASVVAIVLLANPPAAIEARGVMMKVRFEWGIGLYLTLALSLLSAPFAA